MKHATFIFLLATFSLTANFEAHSAPQPGSEVGLQELPSYSSLRTAYPDGRMTLGFRQLHSLKKHFERIDTLHSRFKQLAGEQASALEAAGKFFRALDLSDTRKSVVVIQIDLGRSELLTKNADDQFAGMDKAGGISSASVQQSARLIDAVIRRTIATETAIAEAEGLANKFSVLSEAVVDPLVLSSSMEVATNAFLEAAANASKEIDELRRTDPRKYVDVSRWIATARAAGEVVEKSAKGGKDLDGPRLSGLGLPYQPTDWAGIQIRSAADSVKAGTPGMSLSILLDRLNANPSFPIDQLQGGIRGLDFSALPIADPSIMKYESAATLKEMLFRQYKPVTPHAKVQYLNLYGSPAAVRTTEIPVVGGRWQPYPKGLDMSSSGFSRAMRLYPLAEVIRANELSSTVALDTLFVQLTTPSGSP